MSGLIKDIDDRGAGKEIIISAEIRKVPIVLAAFGTTTAARQSYTFLDQHIRAAFPDHEVHWAFSSRMVRDFDQQRRGRKWKGPGELLEELRGRGVLSGR